MSPTEHTTLDRRRIAARQESPGSHSAPPAPEQRPAHEKEVIDAMVRWSADVVEQPHHVFGGLPICPFARAARLRRTIRFEVLAFDAADTFAPDSAVLCLVDAFQHDPGLETLFVIHPDPRGIGGAALEAFVARLNACLDARPETNTLQAFEAHPESAFCVGGVYTRRSPYPSFQVLSRSLLKSASDSLLGSGYYDQFTPAMLRAVGMPRGATVEKRPDGCSRRD